MRIQKLVLGFVAAMLTLSSNTLFAQETEETISFLSWDTAPIVIAVASLGAMIVTVAIIWSKSLERADDFERIIGAQSKDLRAKEISMAFLRRQVTEYKNAYEVLGFEYNKLATELRKIATERDSLKTLLVEIQEAGSVVQEKVALLQQENSQKASADYILQQGTKIYQLERELAEARAQLARYENQKNALLEPAAATMKVAIGA